MKRQIKIASKWLFVSILLGIVGGILGGIFHKSLDVVTHTREANTWLILFLPLAGVVITALYAPFQKKERLNTNRIIAAVESDEYIPLVISPLIFAGTLLTHLFGGSAGREGAALQLGGSISYNVGKMLKLDKDECRLAVMAGMSSFFSAMFGTPLTAAVFALEVIKTHNIHRRGAAICVLSSLVAYGVAHLMGTEGVRYTSTAVDISFGVVARCVILAALCALVGVIFCLAIKYTSLGMKKLFKNAYVRTVVGSFIIIGMAALLGTAEYNGAGMGVIERAINGKAGLEVFILKIIFTAITIGAGFKGGEIVPTLFIGSTFGCAVGSLLGIEAGFAASLGFVAVFCAVVKCPIASVILGAEVFGVDHVLMYALVCAIAFVLSGKTGLYKHVKRDISKEGNDIHNEIIKA